MSSFPRASPSRTSLPVSINNSPPSLDTISSSRTRAVTITTSPTPLHHNDRLVSTTPPLSTTPTPPNDPTPTPSNDPIFTTPPPPNDPISTTPTRPNDRLLSASPSPLPTPVASVPPSTTPPLSTTPTPPNDPTPTPPNDPIFTTSPPPNDPISITPTLPNDRLMFSSTSPCSSPQPVTSPAPDYSSSPPPTPVPPVPPAPSTTPTPVPQVPPAPSTTPAASTTPTPPKSSPLRWGSSPPPKSSPPPPGLVVGIVIGGVVILAILSILFIWCKKKKRRDHDDYVPPPHGRKGGENSLPPLSPAMSLGFAKSTFSYDELAMATDGFSEANFLGQGGFGYVHKGVLPNGKEVAVKQLKAGSGQGEREFQSDVEIISRVHHKHLVSLVGYCITGSQRMLVYEFVPNNTMEFHLHGEGRPTMDWSTRLRIALGSAKGLAYLHEDCHPKIIHRDIKAANILLDFHFEAMVADFGLAKLCSDVDTHISTRVMGTFGC